MLAMVKSLAVDSRRRTETFGTLAGLGGFYEERMKEAWVSLILRVFQMIGRWLRRAVAADC